MKLKNLILGLLATAAVFASCAKAEEPAEPKMTLSTESITFAKVPTESQSVTVTSTREWIVNDLPDWLTVTVGGTDIEGVKQAAGETTVTVTASENTGAERVDTILFNGGSIAYKNLVVSQEGTPVKKGDGSKENPFNVAEAIEKAIEIGQDAPSTEYYYIKGYITSISQVEVSYGNATFYIGDTKGATENLLYCFQVKNVGATKFTSEDQINVDDEVVMYAQIYNYKGNTPETSSKGASWIYTLNGQGGGDPQPGADPAKAELKSVQEFISLADVNTYYKLHGTISGFSTLYCSFNITDETGSIYVYSLVDSCKTKYKDILKNGYTVTVSGKYAYYTAKSQHEVVDGVIIDYTEPKQEIITTDKISDVFAAAASDSILLNNALVVAAAKTSYLVTDSQNKDYLFVYQGKEGSDTAVKVGDKVNISAHKELYNSMCQLATPKTTVVSSGTAVTWPTPEDITSTFDSFTSTTVKYVSFSGTLSKSGTTTIYYNVAVNEATKNTGSLLANDALDALVNVPNTTFEGFYVYTSGTKYINLMYTKSTESSEPYMFVTPATQSVASSKTSATLTVATNVSGWNATVTGEGAQASVAGNTITVTFPANTTSNDITYTVTVTPEPAVQGLEAKTATITQYKVDASTYTKIDKIESLTADTYYMAAYMTKASDDTDLSAYPYHLWDGTVTGTASTNSDLKTTRYSYVGDVLTMNPSPSAKEGGAAADVTVEAVSGKANTYYVKVGGKYLASGAASNRRMILQDDAAEWVAKNNTNGGITLTDGGVSLGTAGAASDFIRSYAKETSLKYGLVFFKKN